jgi:hypothetical protein
VALARRGTGEWIAIAIGVCALIAGTAFLPPALAAEKNSTPPPAASSIPEKLPPAKNSEGRLQANTVHLLRLVEFVFPYYRSGGVIGGYRQDSINDHPSGQALDIMAPNGGRDPKSVNEVNKIAAFLMANADQLGVTYMVWRQHIWYPGQAWRLMDDRGHWTHNHMDHIHVLVDGSFEAKDQLVMPDDLRVPPNSMPDGEALRRQHEQRLLIMNRISEAQIRVTAAEAVNATLTDRNSVHAQQLSAAQIKVGHSVRESYMTGLDSEVLMTSVMLMDGPNLDPTIAMALERVLRSQDSELNGALDALSAAAKELAANGRELSEAREELSRAQAELADLDD